MLSPRLERSALYLLTILLCGLGHTAESAPVKLSYAAGPVDNPLKGLVPYDSASGHERFPHSMEFRYFSLADLMTGPESFDWSALEKTLRETSARKNHLIFRVYCEYPGKGVGIPRFLLDRGVKVTKWQDDEGAICHTPDYGDAHLRQALGRFIAALGAKYDGDPRVAFITAGLLGKWGEWHDYPRDDLWASKPVQVEVMDAYEKAFKTTKILLRYPAGPETYWHAANHLRPFGYHDDSFCWATLDTGKDADSWFFEPSLKSAGALEKWKTQPIGGEIRPDLWKTMFTVRRHPRNQGFVKCVERTHASWLMDSGLFDARFPMTPERRAAALEQVSRMGYDLHVAEAGWKDGMLALTIVNRGVAPFYYDWPVVIQRSGEAWRKAPASWKLSAILPGKQFEWKVAIGKFSTYRLRVPNPMKGGRALRFANESREGDDLVIELSDGA